MGKKESLIKYLDKFISSIIYLVRFIYVICISLLILPIFSDVGPSII